ncbi:hypothetical protein [Desulfosudis oleivorans]|uniref:hypothetical protein n=1 Tax=Desulfosudis oleivorans TaxID=181663 RepID=UPI001294748D|nr:hypothetical protein [Desulfosudis oleivorans]
MNLNYLKYFFTKDPLSFTAPAARPRLNIIIFSKNRACQVESLLRSIRDHLVYVPLTVTVLYRATDKRFKAGYEKTIRRHPSPGIQWIEETNFYRDLTSRVLALPPEQLIIFLVDDNIVFKKIDLQFIISQFTTEHLFISLRAGRHYTKDVPVPDFDRRDELLEWQWRIQRKASTTWNYPFSVDGNIYHVGRMQQVMRHIRFVAPNSFESAMHDYRKTRWVRKRNRAIAPVEPVIVNNPLNRVQTEGETWHKQLDPAAINEKYLAGLVLDNAKLYNCDPTDTHCDLGLHWSEKRES